MARPTSKPQLISAATDNYDKLILDIEKSFRTQLKG